MRPGTNLNCKVERKRRKGVNPEIGHNGVQNYKGYKIMWDIARIVSTPFWKGTAAIVSPPDSSPGISRVATVPGIAERFDSEDEARATIIATARQFIDNGMPIQQTKWQPQERSVVGEEHWAEHSRFMLAACGLAFLLGVIAASFGSR